MGFLDKAKALWRGWTNTDSVIALAEFLGFNPRQTIIGAVGGAVMGGWALIEGAAWPVAATLAAAVFVLFRAWAILTRMQQAAASAPHQGGVTVPPPEPANDAIEKALEDIRRQIVRNNGKLHNMEADMRRLVDISAEETALAILFNGLPTPPQIPEHIDATAAESLSLLREAADSYSEGVRRALSGTQWNGDVRGFFENAEGFAKHHLRQIPSDQRPAGVDTLDLLAYHTSRIRCAHLAAFVTAQRGEARDKYRHFLGLLHQSQEAIRMRNQQS